MGSLHLSIPEEATDLADRALTEISRNGGKLRLTFSFNTGGKPVEINLDLHPKKKPPKKLGGGFDFHPNGHN